MSENENPLEKESMEDLTILASGKNYIVHPPLRNKITIWVNCSKDMQIKLTTDDFKVAARTLFKEHPLEKILNLLYGGSIIFIDKDSCKPLHPKKMENPSPIPSYGDVLKAFRSKAYNKF